MSIKAGIILPGGGAKGARQAGALRALDLDPSIEIVAIAGTSVGALNAVGLLSNGSEWLEEIWLNLKQRQIYKPWLFGKAYGFIFKKGLFNANPLKKLITRSLDLERIKQSPVELSVVAANFNTGRVHVANNHTPRLEQHVYASAAFPLAFPIERIDGEDYTDGGILRKSPLFCMPAGLDAYFVVHNDSGGIDHKHEFSIWLHEYMFRAVDMMMTELADDDLDTGLSNVHHLYPSLQLINNPLDFETNRRKAYYEGYATTKSYLEVI